MRVNIYCEYLNGVCDVVSDEDPEGDSIKAVVFGAKHDDVWWVDDTKDGEMDVALVLPHSGEWDRHKLAALLRDAANKIEHADE